MILVDGEKYSCVQCIRGHRSSTCKHSSRPLVQVRSRGRPALNSGLRVAVTETELVLTRDQVTIDNSQQVKKEKPVVEKPVKKCCAKRKEVQKEVQKEAKNQCCSTKRSRRCEDRTTVIMLKAAKRQFVAMEDDGNVNYIAPYNEPMMKNFKLSVPQHTRSQTCKATPAPTTAPKRTVGPKLVKTAQMAEFTYNLLNIPQQSLPNSDILTYSHQRQPNSYIPAEASLENKHMELYDVLLANGCTDECSCGPDCNCPGCLIHRTNEELKDYGILDSSNASTPIAEDPGVTNDNANIDFNLINFETIDDILLDHMIKEECFCPPDQCCCYNCTLHGIVNGVRLSDNVQVAVAPPPEDEQDVEDHDCGCLPEECECYNCPKHGRKNGQKIIPSEVPTYSQTTIAVDTHPHIEEPQLN